MTRIRGATLITAIAGSLLLASTASADDAYTIVASGLDSPRGLVAAPGGRLYVAQAGNGGASGRITELRRYWTSSPQRRDVVSGLVSVGDDGEFVGIDGLATDSNGNLFAIMALSESGIPVLGSSLLGHLLKVNTSGVMRNVADVGDVNYEWTLGHPQLAYGDFPDSNPYGLTIKGSAAYVVDAGANTLNRVRRNGTVDVLAYFRDNAIRDSTPTCVTEGPDGALYVGTLALFDSIVLGPSATVYRVNLAAVDPNDETTIMTVATPWATGLWPINGCTFGPDGTFYASQLITNAGFAGGDVVKIPFSNPGSHTSIANQSLLFPAGVAVGQDGAVYVSNGGAFVPSGEVVRLRER
jgi:sugar lactone lactonase YvrE